MCMRFSTGLGDIRVQSPTQWSALYWPHHSYPYCPSADFCLCFRTGTSVCAMGAETNLTNRQNCQMICAYSMKSGVPTYLQQQTYLTRDSEKHTIMRIQRALLVNGLYFTQLPWSFLMKCKLNWKSNTNHSYHHCLVSTCEWNRIFYCIPSVVTCSYCRFLYFTIFSNLCTLYI